MINCKRTLVVGDIHGNYEALISVLEKADYDPQKDRLICLGDYIDGFNQSYEVVEFLMQSQLDSPYQNIYLMGNHDLYFFQVLEDGIDLFRDREQTATINAEWYEQDGESTYDSYIKESDVDINRHLKKFYKSLKYYHSENDILFVHAGYNPSLGFNASLRIDQRELIWDRHLYHTAVHRHASGYKFEPFEKIFIGHTPTTSFGVSTPHFVCNVVNLDQGCKKCGTLSCMDLEKGSWWQHLSLKAK